MVKHIVLMKAKSTTSKDQMRDLFGQLAGLKNKIEGVLDFTGGGDISGGRSHGMTHGFVMTFVDLNKLKVYLPHAEHQKVAANVRALCDDVLVFDYEC